jgi:hypothetical protein
LDLENTTFAFSAVIGTEHEQDEVCFRILVKLINNGQLIFCHTSCWISYVAGSDHVYSYYYGSHHSRLKMDNHRVKLKFECRNRTRSLFEWPDLPRPMFVKTCGFHLQQRYEEEAIDLMHGIQHSKRRRGDDDDGKRGILISWALEFRM